MYLIIFWFILTNDVSTLKKYWTYEHINKSEFSWRRSIKKLLKTRQENFLFWWRLANHMYVHATHPIHRRAAKRLQRNLIAKYNVEIQLGADIGVGLNIVHYSDINITSCVVIGDNFTCHQGVTIGFSKNPLKIHIGNNVIVGCNSVILGGVITIGNNVKIGALSFVNCDIENDLTVYTEKNLIIKSNKVESI